MKLINTDKLNRRRIKTMLKELDHTKSFVRVKRNGIVIRKRKWWSLRREKWLITDLFIALLPKLLASTQNELAVINTRISALLYVSQYVDNYNIVDYMWGIYIRKYVHPTFDNTILIHKPLHIDTLIDFNQILKRLKNYKTYIRPVLSVLKRRI